MAVKALFNYVGPFVLGMAFVGCIAAASKPAKYEYTVVLMGNGEWLGADLINQYAGRGWEVDPSGIRIENPKKENNENVAHVLMRRVAAGNKG
jgi:hypothetical protein